MERLPAGVAREARAPNGSLRREAGMRHVLSCCGAHRAPTEKARAHRALEGRTDCTPWIRPARRRTEPAGSWTRRAADAADASPPPATTGGCEFGVALNSHDRNAVAEF